MLKRTGQQECSTKRSQGSALSSRGHFHMKSYHYNKLKLHVIISKIIKLNSDMIVIKSIRIHQFI